MVELEKARALMLERVKEMGTEVLPLFDAPGRVLAEDISSFQDFPPFDRSPLDGYAVRSVDLPGTLAVIDKIYAGDVSQRMVTKGTAIQIMTGAPIPVGADCVVRQEDTTRNGDEVQITIIHRPFDNYVYKGEDIKAGHLVLEKGSRLSASGITILAALGMGQIPAFKKPTVGLISTGSELQSPGADLKPGHIYNSNLYFLYSRILELGGLPKLYSGVADTGEDIRQALDLAASQCDFIISTGGVSVGEKDLVKQSGEIAGFEILFSRVDVKPGSPMFCGVRDEKILLGLSGNPMAMATTFELMARPALAKMSGCPDLDLKAVMAIAGDSYSNASKKRRFLRVVLQHQDQIQKVYCQGLNQQSGRILTLLQTNGILEMKPHTQIEPGDLVKVYPI
jgi:molybdopterin molybdotransferase